MGGDGENSRQTRQNASEESLKSIQGQLKDILNKIKGLERTGKKQEDKLEDLGKLVEECIQMKAEINELKQQNENQKKRISDLEDFTESLINEKNRNKLEISGLPAKNPENLVDEILKVSRAAKLEIGSKDIKRAFRLKPRGDKPGTAIVEFEAVPVRDKFFKEVKLIRPTTAIVGLNGNSKIYINECLSVKAKSILYRVRQLAYEKKWARVWTYGGCVFLKTEHSSEQIKVRTEGDLEILRN